MVLQVDRAGFGAFGQGGRGGGVRQFDVVVDDDSVVPHGHASVLRLLAVRELSGGEIDVVGLPRQRREGHVDVRLFDRRDAAALVVVRLQPERIEHLHFIAALQITPAVAAARHERAIRNLKLDVQRAALMLELAGRSLLQESVVGRLMIRITVECSPGLVETCVNRSPAKRDSGYRPVRRAVR